MAGSDHALRLDRDRSAWRRVGDDIVALDLQTSSYLAISGTGVDLWLELERGTDRDSLVDVLLDGFDVDRVTAEDDVDRFLDDLRARSLVVEDS